MNASYSIQWTEHALSELAQTITFLEENWTEKEITRFASKLDYTIELISKNPKIFRESKTKKGIHRVVILKLNTLYYRINGNTVEILSLFSNRQRPSKRSL